MKVTAGVGRCGGWSTWDGSAEQLNFGSQECIQKYALANS